MQKVEHRPVAKKHQKKRPLDRIDAPPRKNHVEGVGPQKIILETVLP